MNSRWFKQYVAGMTIAALAFQLFGPGITLTWAAADTCTWTGAVSASWSNGGNWTGCDNGNVPDNGDYLIFPLSASNKATNNDLSSLQVAAITISGSGYTIAGNAFTISSVSGITAAQSATISAPVTYNTGSHVNFYPAAGATLTLSGTSTFSMSSFYETNVGSSTAHGTVDFSGTISGSSAAQFIAVEGAKIIVRGASNTYTAGAVGAETNGIFECRSATCFGNSANIIYLGGGQIDLYTATTYTNTITTSVNTPDDSIINAHAGVILSGNATINDDLLLNQSTSAGLELSGTISNVSTITTQANTMGATINLSGDISGSGSLHLLSGPTYIGGSNTYTGQTTIEDQATAIVLTAGALGTTAAGTTIHDGGALLLASGSAFTLNEPLTIIGNGNPASPHAIDMDAGDDITLAGDITLTGNADIANQSTGTTLSLTGVIKGTGTLTLTGTWDAFSGGYIELNGSNPNTFNGNIIVNGGTVYFQKTGAIPHNLTVAATNPSTNRASAYFYLSSNVINDNGLITMGNDEKDHLTFGADQEVIGGLVGTGGTIQVQNDNDTVIIKQDSNTTYSGSFYTDGHSATFDKQGSGSLTLTGNAINASDNITFKVSQGTVVMNGNIKTTDGGIVMVNGGTVKGVGTLGATTVTSGNLAPGNSPGILHLSSLTLASGGTYQVEIASDSSYDQVVSTGAVSLAGTLALDPTYTPANGTVFTIISGSAVTGTFTGLGDGATTTANGLNFRVNYLSDKVTLTYLGGNLVTTPTPTGQLANTGAASAPLVATGLVLISLGALLYYHRRSAVR